MKTVLCYKHVIIKSWIVSSEILPVEYAALKIDLRHIFYDKSLKLISFLLFVDPNCVEAANGACTKCATRWYLKDGVCTAVSDQCNTWNEVSGECTSCFEGWALNAGKCEVAGGQNTSTDPNCNQSDANGTCTKCNFRWVLKNGTCSVVSDQCKTWDESTGDCTSCYDGWTLSAGQCTVWDQMILNTSYSISIN